MIKSLSILNFQSHEKTKLNFSPGVNVIVGGSDSGKTAILRALRWVSRNRPSGDSIRSNWGGATNVLFETEEAFVRRVKDKTDQYELLLHGQRNLVFKAFSTTVPQEIASFLNLDDVNVQNQLDAPFLLSKTSGEVSAYFNKVAHLEKIDSSTSKTKATIQELKNSIGRTESDILLKKENLAEYDHLEVFETEVEVLEQTEKELQQLRTSRTKLNSQLTAVTAVETEIEDASFILAAEESVLVILADYKVKKSLETEQNAFSLLIKKLKRVDAKIKESDQLLLAENPINNILGLFSSKRILQTDTTALDTLITNISVNESEFNTTEKMLSKLEAQFYKEMPNICPLCNTPITK